MRLMGSVALLCVAVLGAGFDARAQVEPWPPLPKQGFIVGRTATRADVARGDAVFVPEVGGASAGKPLRITIPQYAYYKEGSKKTPVIIIQGEEVQGMKMVGARLANGESVVGLLANFELLGQVTPK